MLKIGGKKYYLILALLLSLWDSNITNTDLLTNIDTFEENKKISYTQRIKNV
jgi:hypothetical protein